MIVAEICLYGNREIGFDYLARTDAGFTADSMPGTGEPMRFESMTAAIWAADRELAPLAGRYVNIFAPGGERYTEARLGSIPSAGSLAWVPVPNEAAA